MSIRSPFSRFRRDTDGTITMEFAIVAPLFIFTIIIGFELFDAFKSNSRAAKATYTLADILSRQVEIDDDYVSELHLVFDALLPWLNEGKTVRITSIVYDEGDPDDDTDNQYVVSWSKHSDETNTMNIAFELTGSMLTQQEYVDILPTIADGDSIILVETTVPHRSLVSVLGLGDLVWRNQVAIRPRFVDELAASDEGSEGGGDDGDTGDGGDSDGGVG